MTIEPSMPQALKPHPTTPPRAISSVTAEIAREGEDMVVIRFAAIGAIDKLRIPEPEGYAKRRDGLWQSSCFEAFVRGSDNQSYVEYNFSPSTAWASFAFHGYRHRSSDPPAVTPHFDVETKADRLEVAVTVDTSGIAQLPGDAPWRINLSAVIEETDGTKSYWALAHPTEGPPDFHHPDCFVLELPPAV